MVHIQDILFILVEYLTFEDLEILSQVITISDNIYSILLSKQYSTQTSSKFTYQLYHKNSVTLTDIKRKIFDEEFPLFGSDNINRVFKFDDKHEIIFVTRTGQYNRALILKGMTLKNEISLINSSEIESLLFVSIKDRIKTDYQLKRYWNKDEAELLGINFMDHYKINREYGIEFIHRLNDDIRFNDNLETRNKYCEHFCFEEFIEDCESGRNIKRGLSNDYHFDEFCSYRNSCFVSIVEYYNHFVYVYCYRREYENDSEDFDWKIYVYESIDESIDELTEDQLNELLEYNKEIS